MSAPTTNVKRTPSTKKTKQIPKKTKSTKRPIIKYQNANKNIIKNLDRNNQRLIPSNLITVFDQYSLH